MQQALIGGQIAVSVIIVILILIQERSAGAGGLFGGGGSEFYQKRRGLEKLFFVATIAFVTLFAALSIVSLVLSK
ncbi:MAG: preprotein translocase subunit SecG [Candidatus Colwellbacteria bacterium]|nr:preprotein translocase subunit SecG [Candidatus Colwellbacteria bacterium]